ncbi:surface-adhesin E family protein [Nitrosomonas sp.]|uniref:surface-adhesin E family protein n=1 Tax=Nitrosomonas sp. TaxID=42353 RepID=UPI0025E67D43|nr:surface-adhesin E family protein [Nitrosomonas sp.]
MLVLLWMAIPVQAKWIKVDIATKYNETHYFDPETILRDGVFRKIWVLSSYEEKQEGGFRAIKTRYEFDCQHHQARSITMLLYPDQNAMGVVIGARHNDSDHWFGFSANSMFQHIEQIICIDD